MYNFLFSFTPEAIVVWIIFLVFLLYYLLGRYYFFEKIGEIAWKGLVPIYSEYLYFKRAKVNPWSAVFLLTLGLLFYLLSFSCLGFDTLHGICTFFTIVSLIFYVLLSWKVNYYISKKFKKSYMTALSLTFMPFIAFPYIGLNKLYKWSRFTKVNNNFLEEDFYGRRVSVNEMCLTNVFMMLCFVALTYIFIYIFVIDLPKEFLLEIIWSPKFIIFIAVSFSIVAIFGTLLDYYGNLLISRKRRK